MDIQEKLKVNLRYTNKGKYSGKKWIAFCKHELGGFSFSYLYNGGRFNSEKEVLEGIKYFNEHNKTFEIIDLKRVNSYEELRA